MREESTLDRIVFRAVAGIVSYPDFDADGIYHRLQIVFENVLARRVASAAIHQQQNRIGVRITLSTNPVPIPLQTVTGELGGVTRQTNVDMAAVANQIKDAMRNDHTIGPTGKIMVEGFERLAASDAAFAKQLSEKLLRFGIH